MNMTANFMITVEITSIVPVSTHLFLSATVGPLVHWKQLYVHGSMGRRVRRWV